MKTYSSIFLDKREKRRVFLLKFHAMHEVNGMPWADCAAVYETETGKPISANKLRLRVKRAVENTGFMRIVEFPEKVVVSTFELTTRGCIWCAIRKFFTDLQKRLHFRKNR